MKYIFKKNGLLGLKKGGDAFLAVNLYEDFLQNVNQGLKFL